MALQTQRDSVVRSLTDLGERWLHLDPAIQVSIVKSLLAILFLLVTRAVILRVVRARATDPRTRYSWGKTVTYFTVILGLLIVGRIWFSGLRDIATFLGLVTAGLAIALKDPIVNLGGWLFIIWRRPFVVGDRIQIGQHAGDVIDVRIFQIVILEIGNWVDADQSTGRLINIPNGMVFREPLANYTRGMQFIWNELRVPVTFESDWRKAKEILASIVETHAAEAAREAEQELLRASRQYMIFYSTLTPTVYTAVRDNGVVLTLRYLCHPRRRRGSEHAIWEDVLLRFADHDDIAFALPTTRFFDNAVEGKPGLRPPPEPTPGGPRSE